jgi:hypothetical protein
VTHVTRPEKVVCIDEAIELFDEMIGETISIFGEVQDEVPGVFKKE